MKVTFRELIQNLHVSTSIRERIKIFGTEDVQFKIVTWVTVSPSPDTFDSLSGGELILYQEQVDENRAQRIVRLACEAHLTGVLFVRENILYPCDDFLDHLSSEYEIPIAVFPKEINLGAFEKVSNELIIRMKNPEIIEESFISDFLFQEDRHKLLSAIEQAEGLFLDPKSFYQIAVLKVKLFGGNRETKVTEEFIYQAIFGHIKREKWHCYCMHFGHLLILLMESTESDVHGKENYHLLINTLEKMKKNYPNVTCKAALGRSNQNITRIKASFDEALFIMNMFSVLSKCSESEDVVSYYDIGFYQLLRVSHNTEEYIRFYKERVGALEKYDKENGTDLLFTLRQYLENDCNLNKTAQIMYVHGNTLRYRFNKIEEVLDIDFKNTNDLMQLYICLYIANYMGICSSETNKSTC